MVDPDQTSYRFACWLMRLIWSRVGHLTTPNIKHCNGLLRISKDMVMWILRNTLSTIFRENLVGKLPETTEDRGFPKIFRLINKAIMKIVMWYNVSDDFLRLDEAIASRAVFIIVSGSDGRADGRTDGNAFEPT